MSSFRFQIIFSEPPIFLPSNPFVKQRENDFSLFLCDFSLWMALPLLWAQTDGSSTYQRQSPSTLDSLNSVFDYIHQQDHAELAEQLGINLAQTQAAAASPGSVASDDGSSSSAPGPTTPDRPRECTFRVTYKESLLTQMRGRGRAQ
ncbi:hypothetical protein TNIN_329271 [Trichonephila inaurata madagascariensis]|uniref:Uncharacterized protein n=1 Tax=Trichonephila inaurata madagascariensis TaxID=2747483 RepID=A0A8X7BPH5_9ARAC|nr:hypothetical protein TNIN_329271 [Trichonephila inaurata madagascariensis]